VRAWLTPDTLPAQNRCYALVVPDDDDWWSTVLGALVLLTNPVNFELYGSVTPDETAARFADCVERFTKGLPCMYLGTVFSSVDPVIPAGCLRADGAQVLQADYLDLYAIVGNTFGGADPGYFRLPDLQGRVALGTGPGPGLTPRSAGDTGGSETHQLTTSEMPSHNHSVHMHGTPGVGAPGAVPFEIPWPFAGVTGNQGGDADHENMPPFLALYAYIVAE